MGQTREQKIINQLSDGVVQRQTAIATDMFLPNHSGIRERLDVKRIPHAYGGFQQVINTITIAAKDTWYHITNAGYNLWVFNELSEMTYTNDQLTINKSGDYSGIISLGLSALNGKDYFIRIFNVTQNKQEGYYLGSTTSGASNYANLTLPLYLEAVKKGDVFEFEIECITDATNVVIRSGVFWIKYLHE